MTPPLQSTVNCVNDAYKLGDYVIGRTIGAGTFGKVKGIIKRLGEDTKFFRASIKFEKRPSPPPLPLDFFPSNFDDFVILDQRSKIFKNLTG